MSQDRLPHHPIQDDLLVRLYYAQVYESACNVAVPEEFLYHRDGHLVAYEVHGVGMPERVGMRSLVFDPGHAACLPDYPQEGHPCPGEDKLTGI